MNTHLHRFHYIGVCCSQLQPRLSWMFWKATTSRVRVMRAEDIFSLRVSVHDMKFTWEHLSDCNNTCVSLCHTAAETERQIMFYHDSNLTSSGLCYGAWSDDARKMLFFLQNWMKVCCSQNRIHLQEKHTKQLICSACILHFLITDLPPVGRLNCK